MLKLQQLFAKSSYFTCEQTQVYTYMYNVHMHIRWSCIPVGATAKGKQTWENNHFTYGWSRILGLFLWLWHTLNTRKSSLFFRTQTLKTAHVRRYQMLFRNIYIAQTLHGWNRQVGAFDEILFGGVHCLNINFYDGNAAMRCAGLW